MHYLGKFALFFFKHNAHNNQDLKSLFSNGNMHGTVGEVVLSMCKVVFKLCALGCVGPSVLGLGALNRPESSSPYFNYYINYSMYFCLACSPIQCYAFPTIIILFIIIFPGKLLFSSCAVS